MIRVFADTAYYLALLNPNDALHESALAATERLDGPIVTSDWVLMEVLNALSHRANRARAVELVRGLDLRRDVEVVRASHSAFRAGLELFARRRDKDWSLTDCISFNIMKSRGIRSALTTDRHFEQAGFHILLT